MFQFLDEGKSIGFSEVILTYFSGERQQMAKARDCNSLVGKR